MSAIGRTSERGIATAAWPKLTLPEWQDTRDTLHMMTQVIGKVRLSLEPMVNHWWQVPLYVSSRGLTTSLMYAGGRGLEIEFDFHDHLLDLRTTDDQRRVVPLEGQSVASFYRRSMTALDELAIPVEIFARPVEVERAIPFAEDEEHRSYDPGAVHRFWLMLLQIDRVMRQFRARFIGKASPVHFFWGSFDLAVTRFSGRRAPKHPGGVPNTPVRVQELAYSHEVSSCGYWPGASPEGSFYAYAYPTPAGFDAWKVDPDAAFFDAGLGEFLLPYEAVRTSDEPDATLLSFLQTTYEAAAQLALWDRAALEIQDEP